MTAYYPYHDARCGLQQPTTVVVCAIIQWSENINTVSASPTNTNTTTVDRPGPAGRAYSSKREGGAACRHDYGANSCKHSDKASQAPPGHPAVITL